MSGRESDRLVHVEMVMGMAVSIDVRDGPLGQAEVRAAVTDVVQWLHHVDATFSTYKEDSPISRIGRGELAMADADDEIRSVLAMCEALNADTDGAFDILSVPAPNGTHLDPSGVVKGWSIERAAGILTERGVQHFCLNAGGDIAVRGAAGPGEPWRIGIRHPDEPLKSAAVLEANGPLAIATSATYERGAHIIDPSTGEPTTDVASVTIVGPDLTFADAYATAVFVMGVAGLRWLDKHPAYGGFVITHDATTWSTPVFDRYRIG